MQFFQLFLFLFPLGLDTLGVSLSLGMKSSPDPLSEAEKQPGIVPYWLRSALLFALAEMLMPIVGLLIGFTISTAISGIMHYIGALLLIVIGAWELLEEGREYVNKRKKPNSKTFLETSSTTQQPQNQWRWNHQLLLALSISLDELAVGFSLGSVGNKTTSPFLLCVFIGLQGLFMALLGLSLGRTLRQRLKQLKEWSELLSAILLIGLGIWLIFT